MLFIWCYQNLKFLQYASHILKHWIVSNVISKFTLRSSGIPRSRRVSLDSPLVLSMCVLAILLLQPLSISYFSKLLQR